MESGRDQESRESTSPSALILLRLSVSCTRQLDALEKPGSSQVQRRPARYPPTCEHSVHSEEKVNAKVAGIEQVFRMEMACSPEYYPSVLPACGTLPCLYRYQKPGSDNPLWSGIVFDISGKQCRPGIEFRDVIELPEHMDGTVMFFDNGTPPTAIPGVAG